MINYNEASPILINCIFHNNTGNSRGAGMYNHNSSPKLTNCKFSENSTNYGGGIYNVRSNITLHNCIFTKNRAENSGGGIYNYDSSNLILTNCTFFGNSAGNGSALACDSAPSYPSIIEVTNCIFWDNQSEIWNNANSTITINYSNIFGGWPGKDNIDADPCFVDPGYRANADDPNIVAEPNDPNAIWVDGDYHLKSQEGRWDPDSESWVFDDVTSPCIDAGDPNSPVASEPFPNGGRINMGAYGGTTEASKSP